MPSATPSKYKQVEFMADKIGKVYDGVVSGLRNGVFTWKLTKTNARV